jgi:hypothetical protein
MAVDGNSKFQGEKMSAFCVNKLGFFTKKNLLFLFTDFKIKIQKAKFCMFFTGYNALVRFYTSQYLQDSGVSVSSISVGESVSGAVSKRGSSGVGNGSSVV